MGDVVSPPVVNRRAFPVLPLLALLAAACEGSSAGPPARLWNLFGLVEAFHAQEQIVPGAIPVLPAGLPPSRFLKQLEGGRFELPTRFAYTEGRPSAYISIELWSQYPAVWVQPMYVLTTGWNPMTKVWAPVAGAKPIFTVGPQSGFYSAFWRVFYAVVPQGTPPDKYRSSRQILEDKLPLHPGPGRLCALAPSDFKVDKSTPPAPDLLGVDNVGEPNAGKGWVDGQEAQVDVLDFGLNRFTWNERLEVAEEPLLLIFARKADGGFTFTNLPAIGGTGPLFARQAPKGPPERPAFGSLWRLYGVALPPSAGVVLPPSGATDGLSLEGLATHKGTDLTKDTWYKVAVNADECFKPDFPAKCRWLDSQERIEAALPMGIVRTEALVTCPFVSYDGKAVKVPQ